MSLEQQLAENTAALKQLIVVLSSAPIASQPDTAPPAAAAVPEKKTRKAKEVALLLNEGDPEGTKYFHIAEHNTVYRQLPGDVDCTLTGATQVTGAEYLIQKAELAKKFPTAVTPEPVTATTAPIATVPVVAASAGPAFSDVVAKLRELQGAHGNAAVGEFLAKNGVKSATLLNGIKPNAELIAELDNAILGL